MKTLNFKALYKFEVYVVTELRCEETSVQIKLDFDKRFPVKCPYCSTKLAKNKVGKSCAMDCPMGGANTVFILFPTYQGRCSKCQRFVTTRPKEIHPTKTATWRYMRLVSSWAGIAPANQIGKLFSISGSTVRNYDKEVLKEDTPPPKLDGIRALLVDEKSIRKKHNYVTVVINADTGEVLYMAEGKKGATLDGFFEQLSDSQKASIQAVGMDRGGAYRKSVKKHLPDAAIVFDHFHLKMNINTAVDEVRRAEWRKADHSEKKFIKSSRYILLSNQSNLDDSGLQKLKLLQEANESIATAYLLKEQFSAVYQYKREGWARKYLENWCELAESSGLKPFQKLAKSFRKSANEILYYVKHKIIAGKIEGTNNLISRIVHRACGVTDLGYLYTRLRHDSVMRSV